jgi:predicted N-acetyltransferase YhbS
MLTKEEALTSLRPLMDLPAPVWLVGGLAADFHAGRWTRDHHDIDLVAFEEDRSRLSEELARVGFTRTDDRGWITNWTRSGRDIGEVSIAFEDRVDPVTGRLVIRREHAADGVVPGIYLEVPGNLDPSRWRTVEGVSARVASAEAEWVFTKGFRAFRPSSRLRASAQHNLRLLEEVLSDDERRRLLGCIGRRLPLDDYRPSGRIRQRTFAGHRDLVAMQRLASGLWPIGLHAGGLAWCVATDQFGDEIALFEDGDELVGFAGTDPPGQLVAQVDPDRPDAASAIVDWFTARAGPGELRVDVIDDDRTLRGAVEAAGFGRLGDDRPIWQMRRAATTEAPPPPHGYMVRSPRPDETAERVAVHRAAWSPHALPWHPEHRPSYPPGAQSGHSQAIYERVRAAWLYDPDLDLVALAPDGSFAGCCIVWLDPATGVAEIEPLGVGPEHRRRGVAGALCHEALRRVANAGGREIVINSGPNIAYPAPGGAYAKAGFRAVDRGRSYRLTR